MIDYTQLLITLCVVFIMICIYHCSCKSKLEHMSDINDEAISMIASLYNGEKLIVNNLEVKDNIVIGKEASIGGSLTVGKAATIGPAYIGGWGGNINDMGHAQFSHKGQKSQSQYALMQRNDGHTWVNAPNGKELWLNNNHTSISKIHKTGQNITGNNSITGTVSAPIVNASTQIQTGKAIIDNYHIGHGLYDQLVFKYNNNASGAFIIGNDGTYGTNTNSVY